MTLQEFKAWFGGFTEDMAGAPNKKQWERIKARVEEIDGTAVTRTVFVDHYYPPYRRYFDGWQYLSALGSNVASSSGTCDASKYQSTTNTLHNGDCGPKFDSAQAMLALGKADYQSIA